MFSILRRINCKNMAAMLIFFSRKYRFCPKFESTFIIYYPIPAYIYPQ
jgi:hypothetical protein